MPRPRETPWVWAAVLSMACLGACTSGSLATRTTTGPVSDTRLASTEAAREPSHTTAPTAVAEAASALRDQAALAHLPRGAEQLAALCDRGNADPVSIKLCSAKRIGSLADLLDALGLAFNSKIGNGELGNPSFALLGHSTSLAARHVSPINPRVFIFTSPKTEGPIRGKAEADPDFIALAFSRGEPLVELVARDEHTRELRFFLVRFELGCERTDLPANEGCGERDLYTPAVEQSWTGASVYDDRDLANTLFDCNTCHQPGGPGTPKMLRMIEQRPPWTHFFRDSDQGKLLIGDYFTAHDKSETYGGIPGALVSWSEPARLEGLVEHEGFMHQPLELPTRDLARMVMKGEQPADLPSYVELFERARAGKSLPVPFPDYTFVEPRTLARAADGYKKLDKTIAGELGLDRLHSDSARSRVGLAAEPGATGEAILLAMCARCHNDTLDQSLSRARFDTTHLADLDAKEKALIVERLRLPASSPLKMPPMRFGALSTEEIERVAKAVGE